VLEQPSDSPSIDQGASAIWLHAANASYQIRTITWTLHLL